MGMPKTGTTYLQQTFSNNQSVFEAMDICYPTRWRNGENIAHHSLGRALCDLAMGENKELVREFIDFIATTTQTKSVLMSSEAMTNSFSPRNKLAFLATIEKLSKTSRVKIIVYLRRIDSFFESMYLHSVKTGELTESFDEYLQKRQLWSYEYFKFLNNLKKIDKAEVLISKFEGVPDLFHHFCQSININSSKFDYSNSHMNMKLGIKLQSLLYRFNEIVPEALSESVNRRRTVKLIDAGRFCLDSDITKYTIIQRDQRELIQRMSIKAAELASFPEYIDFYSEHIYIDKEFLTLDSVEISDQELEQFIEFLTTVNHSTADEARA